MYSQIIIRCYTEDSDLPAGFEDLTQSVPLMWVNEPNWIKADEVEEHAWIKHQLDAFESHQKDRGFEYKLVLYLAIDHEKPQRVIKLDHELVCKLAKLRAEVECDMTQ